MHNNSDLPFEVVFTDIDGTLLNKDRELSQRTKKIIHQLKKRVPFVLISSRMPQAMLHLQEELGITDQPMICYNGGLSLIEYKEKTSNAVPISILEKLLDFNRELNVHIGLYKGKEWHVPEYDYWAKREENNTKVSPKVSDLKKVVETWKEDGIGAHKVMAMGEEEKIDQVRDYLSEHFPEKLHLYRSKPTYLEIADKSISKLSGINYLLENHFHSNLEKCLAFGDNYNDAEMLEKLGRGVAVGNAKEKVKQGADEITDTGKQDGVAKTLERIYAEYL